LLTFLQAKLKKAPAAAPAAEQGAQTLGGFIASLPRLLVLDNLDKGTLPRKVLHYTLAVSITIAIFLWYAAAQGLLLLHLLYAQNGYPYYGCYAYQIFLTWYCVLNLYLYIEAYFRHKETDKGKALLY
tara:strand:- start:123 stop:506 length:384 start_codon:yes stop_codon:yes gene_type:complete